MNTSLLAKAANEARGLSIDAVHACSSGHLGLPLGCAEIGAVLYGHALSHNPADPQWLNRDRLVLSAGHGSMFLYSWLHLAGYDLSIEEVRNFRKMGSKTPGHPEFHETPGVEATTGPLGQGVGNAVGIALAAKMAAAKFNTADHCILNHHVVCLAGDGCLQEGVAAEASAFAGHFKLDNLIFIYDSNDVTLDAMASATQSENTRKRYEAYGFNVVQIDGHDMEAFLKAFEAAKAAVGRPQMIIAKTEIARGIPEVAGTSKGHGEGGAKFSETARKGLGLPDSHFHVSEEVRAFFATHKAALAAKATGWAAMFAAWKAANPSLAAELSDALSRKVPADLASCIPQFDANEKIATRKAGAVVLQSIAKACPNFISGSADLHGSTLNYIDGAGDFTPESPTGRNIRFGIREHAMGAIMNGIAYHGLFRASGATFLVFADYLRPSIRVAALSNLPTLYIFTHDSVGVGEDGPTHQPVETVSGLRVIPNLDVLRPADPEECAGAFASAVTRLDGPSVLVLTRQTLPNLTSVDAATRRAGTERGAYILKKETGPLKVILLAAGSEVQHAMAAADQLGEGTRVVSVPSMFRFERQPQAYRDEILPPSCRARVAIEAGVPDLWFKFVGLDGRVIGISRFGLSAPGDQVMKALGITAESVVTAARSLGV